METHRKTIRLLEKKADWKDATQRKIHPRIPNDTTDEVFVKCNGKSYVNDFDGSFGA